MIDDPIQRRHGISVFESLMSEGDMTLMAMAGGTVQLFINDSTVPAAEARIVRTTPDGIMECVELKTLYPCSIYPGTSIRLRVQHLNAAHDDYIFEAPISGIMSLDNGCSLTINFLG